MSDVKTAYIVHFGYNDGDLFVDRVFSTLTTANSRAYQIWHKASDSGVPSICFVDVMRSDEKEIPLDTFSFSYLESSEQELILNDLNFMLKCSLFGMYGI